MRSAVVTGASSGIGRELARLLCKQGFRVLGVGRDVGALEELRTELGGAFEFIACDLRGLGCVGNIASRVAASYSPLDMLVNNAGYGSAKKLVEMTAEEVSSMTVVNFVVPLVLTRELLPYMRSGSTVVNVVTAGIHILMTRAPLYGATKIALHYASEALRRELREKGVHLLEVFPGVVKTRFHERAGLRAPMRGVPPEQAAKAILDAVAKGKKKVYIPWYIGFLRLLGPYLPALY
ncbi:MAG: SDR family NAD(P)-dependent oxidoreductase [Thermofilum sp.]|nr:SDR family NAD(P)-dependent oxidoreductase [Thermofilum sp.]